VILKRMGPADQVTSHFYAWGIRGKQYQYIEGTLPKGSTFHGRLTDHDVRDIQARGGRTFIIESKYSLADLDHARQSCAQREVTKDELLQRIHELEEKQAPAQGAK